jgi:hypothetical protein
MATRSLPIRNIHTLGPMDETNASNKGRKDAGKAQMPADWHHIRSLTESSLSIAPVISANHFSGSTDAGLRFDEARDRIEAGKSLIRD